MTPRGFAFSMKPHSPLGSWKRIPGRPHLLHLPGTSHSQRWGPVGVWTLGQCSWHHRDHSVKGVRNEHTLCTDGQKELSTPLWRTLTTFGMKGGLTFLARRLSQLMDAKKECSCSSTWTHTEITPSVFSMFCSRASLPVVHLRGRGYPLNAWRHAFPAIPPTVNRQPETPHYADAGGHEVCSQTSLPCCSCRMEADRHNREK